MANRDGAADESGSSRTVSYEQLPCTVWLAARDGALLHASPSLLELLGLSAEEAYGFGWTRRAAKSDRKLADRWREQARGELDWEDELKVVDKFGQTHTLLARGHAVRREDGEIECWNGILLDITGRVRWRRRQIRAAESQGRRQEREKIARTLHGSVQQLLYATKTHLARLRQAQSLEQAQLAAESVRRLVDETIRVSRDMTVDLSPPTTDGVVPAMRWLAQWMSEHHDLRVELDTGDDVGRLPAKLGELVFDVSRELLFNVVKHAGTTSAKMEVHAQKDGIEVAIIDRGTGFEPRRIEKTEASDSFGLRDIRARVRASGGDFHVDTSPGQGTTVRFRLPRRA